ncbi:hypothetical protein GFL15_31220, partial [Rhizobium leguminosarum bv. viciae]|nr:hypothetical protein [Rhizobium leguminosarum bv. viciae]
MSELRSASSAAGLFAGFAAGAEAMVVFLAEPLVLTVCLADFALPALPVWTALPAPLTLRPFSLLLLEWVLLLPPPPLLLPPPWLPPLPPPPPWLPPPPP